MILGAKFIFPETPKEEIVRECRGFLERKKKTQEIGTSNAGCIFKNPPDYDKTAAQLIDECGLKNARIGAAAVSEKHANFIINMGRARSGNVMALIDMIRIKVKERFNIELSLEIQIV